MKRVLAAVVALLCLSLPVNAGLNGACVDQDTAAKVLSNGGQSVVGYGAMSDDSGNEGLLFLSLNPETGEWTIMFSPNGMLTCFAAGGENWTPIEPEPPGVDS